MSEKMTAKQLGEQTAFTMEGMGCLYLGLTKREYFAGLAMQGWVANPNEIVCGDNEKAWDVCARQSVRYADALPEELAREAQP